MTPLGIAVIIEAVPLLQSTMQHEWHVLKLVYLHLAIIMLGQSLSPSVMTTPILIHMGSMLLLPLNWMYLWCEVIIIFLASKNDILSQLLHFTWEGGDIAMPAHSRRNGSTTPSSGNCGYGPAR